MTLKAGHVSDFTDSMAKAMEDALKSEWLAVEGVVMPDVGEKYRRLLFVAIAQGVVKHLREKANEAFQIEVRVSQTAPSQMKSNNPLAISVSGGMGGVINPRQANVQQVDEPGNRIVAEGEATNVEILTHE